jgi:hypothetical protein
MFTPRTWTMLVALTLAAGCNSDEKPKPATTATPAADSGAKAGDGAENGADTASKGAAEAGGKVADGGETTGAPTPADGANGTGTTGALQPDPDSESGGETSGGETGDETGGGTGEETGAEEPAEPPADPKKDLLAEVTNRKTKDERATAALAEAKAAGATARELASAANKRGTRLFGTPDRARPFFEYARDEDKRFADASFNLAKLSAMTGEIPVIIEHLTEVKKRGGKRLLQTVEYDPTFALVADDPDVLALLK